MSTRRDTEKWLNQMERIVDDMREREAEDRLHPTTGSARVLPHELDLKTGEIMARCWKCLRLCAFTGCHTYTRIQAYGGATIIFQPDRYYAACPNCGAVQMQAISPQNATAQLTPRSGPNSKQDASGG